jgi:hypothetical protein
MESVTELLIETDSILPTVEKYGGEPLLVCVFFSERQQLHADSMPSPAGKHNQVVYMEVFSTGNRLDRAHPDEAHQPVAAEGTAQPVSLFGLPSQAGDERGLVEVLPKFVKQAVSGWQFGVFDRSDIDFVHGILPSSL